MNYFVTGATGFIGRFLVERLAAREDAKVYILVRESSQEKFDALVERVAEFGDRLFPVYGDITMPGLVDAAEAKKLKGKIDHVFHLAAVYDMNMDDSTADRVNTEGTRNVVDFVNELSGKVRLHHMSSVAVAGGDYVGKFTEDMFDEGQSTKHPYYRTKYQAEKIVREESKVPFRVYRPGAVVGPRTPEGGPKCKVPTIAGADGAGAGVAGEPVLGRLGEAGRSVAFLRPAPTPRTCASHRRRCGGVPNAMGFRAKCCRA